MKKIALLLIIAVFAGSCSLFDKSPKNQEEIDMMTMRNAKLQEDLVNAQHEASVYKMKAEECNNVLAEMQKAEEEIASGLFVVVAGSFKTPDFAKEYAVKIKEMGGEGAIVDGPSDFQLVSYSSHGNLREAVNGMEKARANVAAEAWVYMKK